MKLLQSTHFQNENENHSSFTREFNRARFKQIDPSYKTWSMIVKVWWSFQRFESETIHAL